jgi:hypothetical protein
MAIDLRTAIEARLPDLEQLVRSRRDRGASWDLIATLITSEAHIEVSRETLRLWFRDEPNGDAA